MPPIFLIGYMCSGKSTLGLAVSRVLGLSFIDLDQWIEEREQLTIPEIFAQRGEAAFRQIEMEALRQLAQTKGIVACGGGTPCQPGAMELMNAHGLTVWLQPNDEKLLLRLMEGREKRPLIANIATREQMSKFAEEAMRSRIPYYKQAQLTFDSSALESEQEIEQSAKELSAILRESICGDRDIN